MYLLKKKSWPTRQTISFFFFFTTISIVGSSNCSAMEKQMHIGEVVDLTGKAWVARDPSGIRKVALKKEDGLYNHDILFTEKGSMLTIRLGDKEAAVMIRDDSRIEIDQTKKGWLLDLDHGKVLNTVNSKIKTKKSFRLRTARAILGVRGTTFFVEKDKEKSAFYFCPCEGEVHLNKETVFRSKHHDTPAMITSKNSKTATAQVIGSKMSSHSDQDIEKLQSYIE